MKKLTKAHECIERGARLLATNPDNWRPVSSDFSTNLGPRRNDKVGLFPS